MINLARSFDRENPVADSEVNEKVVSELLEAGIALIDNDIFLHSCGEVPTSVVGLLEGGWEFRRAWTYWVVKGPGVPYDLALYFDSIWGEKVRVNGDCGCRGPKVWAKGYPVTSYHVDTQDGLNALAKMIKSLYRPDYEETIKVLEKEIDRWHSAYMQLAQAINPTEDKPSLEAAADLHLLVKTQAERIRELEA